MKLRHAILASIVFCALPAWANRKLAMFPYQQCHIESTPSKRFRATMNFTINSPQAAARGWLLVMPFPPTLSRQQITSSSMWNLETNQKAIEERELSPERRSILSLATGVANATMETQFHGSCQFKGTLNARRVVPGASLKAVEPLSESDRAQYLAATTTTDYKNPVFQSWLARNNLVKRKDLRDLDLAYSIYGRIIATYIYRYFPGQNRSASHICTTNATDCGGLSILLVSALRANSIPARVLYGRWAKSESTIQDVSTGYGASHVKSEFYIDGIGWIPADMSKAVSNKILDEIETLGTDSGDFITLHTDTDLLIDSHWFGNVNEYGMQHPHFWVTGHGNMEGNKEKITWTVETENLSHSSSKVR